MHEASICEKRYGIEKRTTVPIIKHRSFIHLYHHFSIYSKRATCLIDECAFVISHKGDHHQRMPAIAMRQTIGSQKMGQR